VAQLRDGRQAGSFCLRRGACAQQNPLLSSEHVWAAAQQMSSRCGVEAQAHNTQHLGLLPLHAAVQCTMMISQT
jgi:hypothetical protein